MSLKKIFLMALILFALLAASLVAWVVLKPPLEAVYMRTETVEVTSVFRARKRFKSKDPAVTVQFDDGRIETITVPSIKDIVQGQTLKVEVFQTKEHLIYRLADDQDHS